MKNSTRPGKRLRLHRETLRVLGANSLARVGGGTVIDTSLIETGACMDETQPKTNAWTGRHEAAAACIQVGG